MRGGRARVAGVAAALAIAVAAAVVPGRAQQSRDRLPSEPFGATGEAIFPALEGWGPLRDGTIVLLLGYYNRNRAQYFDIPVGPNNRIEPGGPDYGQPTHFEPSRQHGVFAIAVPKDFGTRRLTWTLTANGHTSTVSFWLNPPYWIDFFKHAANGNTPPIIRFAPDGPMLSGPPLGVAHTLSAAVGQPVPLRVWASDAPATVVDSALELAAIRAQADRQPDPVAVVGGTLIGGAARGGGGSTEPPDIVVNWRKHRAPGEVTLTRDRIPLYTGGDPAQAVEAATTATFHAPGEYVLRAQVNDESGDGGGGDQCCWTTAHVRVTVE
jgi:hypothetical protein